MAVLYSARIKTGFRAIREFSRKLETTRDETLGGCLQTCAGMGQFETEYQLLLGKPRQIGGCVTANIWTNID